MPSCPGRNVELQFRKPAFPRELTCQHAGQQPRIDIASAQHQAERTAPKALGMGEYGRQARGAGALRHGFLNGDEQAQRMLDLLFGDEHDIIDKRAYDV